MTEHLDAFKLEVKQKLGSLTLEEYSTAQALYLKDHRGGDVIFTPGPGWKPVDHPDPAIVGDIIFTLADGTEFLVLKANGDAFVKGEKVQSRQEVYDSFAAWLVEAGIMPRKG